MKGMNLSKFKKVRTDEHVTTLRHPDGHEFRVSHKALTPKLRTQLDAIPLAKGGDVPEQRYAEGDEVLPDEAAAPQPSPDEGSWLQNVDMAKLATPPLPEGPPPEPHSDWEKVAPPPDDGTPKRGLFSPDVPPAPSAPSEAPAAPAAPSLAPTAGALPNTSVGDVYKTGMAGIQAGKEAEQTLGKERLAASQAHEKAIMDAQAAFEKGSAAKLADISNAVKDFQSQHINPNHFLESKSTIGKVSTAIGLILGGIGAGMTGGENQALKFLNAQIDRDIESQKAEVGKRQTLISAYQQQFQNAHVAENMARATELGLYAAHLDSAAAKAADPAAKARALQASASLKAQILPLVQQAQIRDTLSGAQSGTKSKADPASFVRHVVPEPRQKEVFAEIKRAQDTRKIADTALKAFDEAANSNTMIKRIGGIRGDAPAVRALQQALLTTVQDQEGSVRETAMNAVKHNFTPERDDLDSTKARKRESLIQYLTDKSSAPTAKGFGIDLDRFQSTAPVTQSTGKPAPADGATGTYQGKPVVFRGGKWQLR